MIAKHTPLLLLAGSLLACMDPGQSSSGDGTHGGAGGGSDASGGATPGGAGHGGASVVDAAATGGAGREGGAASAGGAGGAPMEGTSGAMPSDGGAASTGGAGGAATGGAGGAMPDNGRTARDAGAARDAGGTTRDAAETTSSVNCMAFKITSGDPRSGMGARFTYASTDDGTVFSLQGLLRSPAGNGPFPAVVINHGKGGTPYTYSARIAAQMVTWGLVAMAVQFSHAPADTGLPAGDFGSSMGNVLRAHKARQLLSCLPYVDTTRVAVHGHSMGAFVTAETLGTYPGLFRAASHTAGGVSTGENATRPQTAVRITTPYQLHHGDMDRIVDIQMDRDLAQILSNAKTQHELIVYPGFDHADVSVDTTMLSRVRTWYQAHGLFP